MTTPALDFKNIQGDVLQGLPKRVQSFIFFSIADPTHFRQRFKAVIPLITTTAQVQADQAAIAAHKSSGNLGLLKLAGTNVAFSSAGLKALGITDALGDKLFDGGQLADASKPTDQQGLADPGTPTGSGGLVDPDWDPLFKQTIHGVFLITGDSVLTITLRFAELEAILLGTIKTLGKVDGAVRPRSEAGHEHFGFQDGVSQPAITGFRDPNTGEFPTDPGVILLSEPGDHPDANTTRPAWAKDSSFLVFRKLRQFVPEFNDFLKKNPIPDPGLPPDQGSELLGARLVGRWKSGAPVVINPVADNPAAAADPNQVNNFDYSTDPNQIACPFAGHLRKMNPRAGFPGQNAVQQRRIIRQGIPYGPEVTPDESHSATSKIDRGLLFVCYQSSLSFGFHFLQNAWANSPSFPPPVSPSTALAGFDAIIGQNVNGARSTGGTDPKNLATELPLPPQLFVRPRGGEYFLSPSISALQTKIASA